MLIGVIDKQLCNGSQRGRETVFTLLFSQYRVMALHYSPQLFDVNTNSQLKMLNFMESTSFFDKSCGQQTAKFFNGFPQPFGFDDRANILEGELLRLMLRRV